LPKQGRGGVEKKLGGCHKREGGGGKGQKEVKTEKGRKFGGTGIWRGSTATNGKGGRFLVKLPLIGGGVCEKRGGTLKGTWRGGGGISVGRRA